MECVTNSDQQKRWYADNHKRGPNVSAWCSNQQARVHSGCVMTPVYKLSIKVFFRGCDGRFSQGKSRLDKTVQSCSFEGIHKMVVIIYMKHSFMLCLFLWAWLKKKRPALCRHSGPLICNWSLAAPCQALARIQNRSTFWHYAASARLRSTVGDVG